MTAALEVASPTRVDLAGGTLDLWPLYCFTGGAVTVNVAIDVWTRARLEPIADGVELHCHDLQIERAYSSLEAALADDDPQLKFLRVALAHGRPAGSFRLVTRSESPVGGGLGGSSSLMVSVLKVLTAWNRRPPVETWPLVRLAHDLEAEILQTPTGTQDYVPALRGGLNIITYKAGGVELEVMDPADSPLMNRFLLVYTGRNHHSGLNNFEVMKSAVARDAVVMNALHRLREVGSEMADTCRAGRWDRLGELFRREYQHRLLLTPAFTCPEIEKLRQVATEAGAEAVKICGAGGGGCVMVWCPDRGRETIAKSCQEAGFQVLNARPVAPFL